MVSRLRTAAWLGVSTLLVGCGAETPPAAEPARPPAETDEVTLHVEGMVDRLGLY